MATSEASRAPNAPAGIALDRPLLFAESVRLVHYAWAVHELPDDAVGLPARRDVHLLAYRDDTHAVRWLELTPLAERVAGPLDAIGHARGRRALEGQRQEVVQVRSPDRPEAEVIGVPRSPDIAHERRKLG